MSDGMQIDEALTQLQAGKFSFRMVDAIKEHVSRLESELEVARALHESAIRDLKLREYAVWRLEREIKAANAKIRALLRANALTETAYREIPIVAKALAEHAGVLAKAAKVAFDGAAADLQSGKTQARLADAFAALQGWLKANAPSEEALRELRAHAATLDERLQLLKSHAAAAAEKAAAYLADLRKRSA